MILIFGGTTEGRAAVNVIEEAGKPYYYSTKGDEQDIYLHHGIRLSGAMTRRTLKAFCRQNDIRLLIDAAHPFAEKLHDTDSNLYGPRKSMNVTSVFSTVTAPVK